VIRDWLSRIISNDSVSQMESLASLGIGADCDENEFLRQQQEIMAGLERLRMQSHDLPPADDSTATQGHCDQHNDLELMHDNEPDLLRQQQEIWDEIQCSHKQSDQTPPPPRQRLTGDWGSNVDPCDDVQEKMIRSRLNRNARDKRDLGGDKRRDARSWSVSFHSNDNDHDHARREKFNERMSTMRDQLMQRMRSEKSEEIPLSPRQRPTRDCRSVPDKQDLGDGNFCDHSCGWSVSHHSNDSDYNSARRDKLNARTSSMRSQMMQRMRTERASSHIPDDFDYVPVDDGGTSGSSRRDCVHDERPTTREPMRSEKDHRLKIESSNVARSIRRRQVAQSIREQDDNQSFVRSNTQHLGHSATNLDNRHSSSNTATQQSSRSFQSSDTGPQEQSVPDKVVTVNMFGDQNVSIIDRKDYLAQSGSEKVLVKCAGCEQSFIVSHDCKLLYCPVCATLTPCH